MNVACLVVYMWLFLVITELACQLLVRIQNKVFLTKPDH